MKETGRGVVVLTNSGSSNSDDIGLHLLDPQSPLQEVKPDYSYAIRQMIDKDGPAGLMEKYKTLKAENPGKYNLDEDAMNTLGYAYLRQEKWKLPKLSSVSMSWNFQILQMRTTVMEKR